MSNIETGRASVKRQKYVVIGDTFAEREKIRRLLTAVLTAEGQYIRGREGLAGRRADPSIPSPVMVRTQEILARYGAENLQQVDPAKYEALTAELSALLDSRITSDEKTQAKTGGVIDVWAVNCALIVKPPCFVYLPTKDILSDTSFDNKYGMEFKSKASAKVKKSKRMTRYDAMVYRPGGEPSYVERGRSLLNTYVPSKVTPIFETVNDDLLGEDNRPNIFLEHLEYLIPDKASRENFLDWCANLIQHPCLKAMFAILFVGPEGTGKSWVANMLRNLVGWHNSAAPRKNQIVSDFNGWIARKRFIVVHELHGRADLAEALQDIITQGHVEVNLKNIEPFEIENYANFFLISNYADAIPISETQRRYLVINCASMPNLADPKPRGEKPFTITDKSREYYARLFDACPEREHEPTDEERKVLGFLLRREIKMDCQGNAPETKALSQVIAAGRTPLQSIMTEKFRDHEEPFHGKVFNLTDILDGIDMSAITPAERNIKAVERAVMRLGCRKIDRPRAVSTKHGRKQLWAKSERDAAMYARQDYATLAKLYEDAMAARRQPHVSDFDNAAE